MLSNDDVVRVQRVDCDVWFVAADDRQVDAGKLLTGQRFLWVVLLFFLLFFELLLFLVFVACVAVWIGGIKILHLDETGYERKLFLDFLGRRLDGSLQQQR